MTEQGHRERKSHRRGLATLLVLLGGLSAAGAAFLPWWRRAYHDPLTGDLHVSIDGGDVAVAVVPLALVAIAGLAAAMISAGVVRLVVGLMIAAAGLGTIGAAVVASTHLPTAEFAARLIRPAVATSAVEVIWPAIALAVIAGFLQASGGALVARDRGRRRATTVAYSAPAARRDAVRREATHREPATGAMQPQAAQRPAANASDPAEWWRYLDAGVDPTDDAGRT